MFYRTSILRWLNSGLLIGCLLGSSSAAIAQQDPIQEAKIFTNQASELSGERRYTEAILLLQRALAIYEKVLGPEHPDTALSLTYLAELHQVRGDYGQAQPLFQRALAIAEKVLGPEHPDTASSLYHLAELYQSTGAYTQAEPLYQRALEIAEKVAPEHLDTARLLYQLAELYRSTKAYGKAEPLYLRSLAIAEKELGPEHRETGELLTAMAALYRSTGDYGKAEPSYRRALAITEKTLGSEHPDTARLLGNLAGLYRSTGAYAKAEPLYQRAQTILEKRLGPEHPDTSVILNNLAGLYQDMGDYGKAEPLYQRALAIAEEALGPEHPDTASSLSNLAEVYRATGDYGKAEPLYQRALAIAERVLGPEHSNTAIMLTGLAGLYRNRGIYSKAEPLLQRALAIAEKVLGPEHPDTALLQNNLAQLYQSVGDYGKAEPLYQRALAIQEKTLGPEHPNTALAITSLAGLFQDTGTYGQVELLYQRALTIREKVLGPEHPDTAGSLSSLASLYQITGNYGKAESLYQRALAIREKVLGPEHPDTARSLGNLAGLYQVTGDYGKAEPLYQRALAISEKRMGPEHPDTATLLGNLAELYRSTGDYGKAEPLYQRALAILEKRLGPEHADTATLLGNLAELYRSTGDYGKAEPLYQRALAISEKRLGLEHRDTSVILNNLARLYHSIGAYGQAESLDRRVLQIVEKVLGPEHPDTARLLSNQAVHFWVIGDLTKALSLLSVAQTVEEKNISSFFLTGSESRKQAYLATMRGSTYANISLTLLKQDHQAREFGIQSVLMTKGRVLDAMTEGTARLKASVKPEDWAIVEELAMVAQQRSALTYQGIGSLKPEFYRHRVQELVARQEQLETDLSARSAEFRQAVAPITFAAVQAAIPNGTVLIEWYRYQPFDPKAKGWQAQWGKPRYVACMLGLTGEPAVVDLGEAESIDQLVHDFRTGLSDATSTYVKDVAKELYQKLLKPLQPHFDHVQQLLLAPDGALNLVPFAALMDESGTYLGSKKSINYITSGRDLLKFRTTTVSKSDMVVVANPDYGPSSKQTNQADTAVQPTRSLDLDRERMTFKPLPGTAEEAKTLMTLFRISEDRVLMQAKATEDRFKQLHGPRILHVATHGFFQKDNEVPTAALRRESFSQGLAPVPLGENPLLRSGLALAGANLRQSGENDDGILTAAELAQMDLRGTQLVVLSACETGVGDVQNGEGVYGLRRALVLAGAESQVTSLWKVADDATKDLMVDYYQRLLKGEGRSEALRNAQLTMMKSKDRSHPYYWAAFVPIGDWRPLAKSH